MSEVNLDHIWPKWKITEMIGKGAFGTVYKAQRSGFDMDSYAAVKVIHIPGEDSQIREMTADGMSKEEVSNYYKDAVTGLANEIALMESLKGSPNIVSIEDYDIEKDDNGVRWNIYIRMELLENLNKYREKHPMNTKDIVRLGVDICNALEYCGKKNIIHRDIKPDNIFVSQFGDFKLGDFGIARHLEGTRATMSQKGTAAYMAPEIYKGERYDATVDIYSLGIVLYRLLNNGRLPFMPAYPQPLTYSDSEAALFKRMSGEIVPLPVNTDPALGAIVCRACHPDAAMRYKTPEEFKAALMSWGNTSQTSKSTENVPPKPIQSESVKPVQSKPVQNVHHQAMNVEKPVRPAEEMWTNTENEMTRAIFDTVPSTPKNSVKNTILFAGICVVSLIQVVWYLFSFFNR